MPGELDGFDLAKQATARWPALKVLLTSGFPDTKLNSDLVTARARLLSKPYRVADLASAIRAALDQDGGEAARTFEGLPSIGTRLSFTPCRAGNRSPGVPRRESSRLRVVRRRRALARLVGAFGLQLNVVLDPGLLDELDLSLDEVDGVFLAVEYLAQQVARAEIADRFAMDDGGAQIVQPPLLKLQVAVENFGDILADQKLLQILQIGQTVEKEDPLDQPIGVLHLIDGFLMLMLAKLGDTPIVQHPRMQKILVDGRQLVLEDLVEVLKNRRVAAHCLVLQMYDRRLNQESGQDEPSA
jgi:hypothetical protein